jgi:ribosomal protein L7/L12
MADTLDPSIKGHIFFAMLTGEYNSVISIYKFESAANKVSMIKALRTVDKRRLGLKEAKDMCDSLLLGNSIKVEVEPNTRNSALLQLRMAGFTV